MRMRKKKHGAERIAACSELFLTERITPSENPPELEIGCGKGAFILECAKRFPERRFIAMERISDVILIAAEKLKAEQIQNVRLINGDAARLPEYFDPRSIGRIYLNFSDPWPKKGYSKRRLTHAGFLALYKQILLPGGEIILKTDNEGLFDFSLEQFSEAGFELSGLTRDLHHSELAADNIMTEYERNFSEKGFPIHRVIARI